MGSKTFQHKRINWSIRKRGKDERTHIKKIRRIETFIAKIRLSLKNKPKGQKIFQPPKKTITVKKHIKIIELYSAKKKSAKPILEYSILKPETNSDSASGKSKGGRFVSAKIVIKNIKKSGYIANNIGLICWNWTIEIKFKDPIKSIVVIKIKPIETS